TMELIICRIRKRSAPKIVKTVRGLGYQVNAE
ncbi:DNA-binding response regulator, partial [Vibrio parahaemolyticus]|nr:DNA-binding response regulator [Vibrio parahaemolyticus]